MPTVLETAPIPTASLHTWIERMVAIRDEAAALYMALDGTGEEEARSIRNEADHLLGMMRVYVEAPVPPVLYMGIHEPEATETL